MTACRFQYEPIPAGLHIPTEPETVSRFDVPWGFTRDELDYEGVALGASLIVIQVDIDRGRIRQDGFMRADARVDSPRVRITLDTRHGPLTMASGHYRRPSYKRNSPADWQHNTRAIVKTLESLRAVDRYGVVQTGEQYKGFLALEAAPTGPFATADGAERWLRERLNAPADQWPDLGRLVRTAQREMHPDRTGDRVEWDLLERAVELMRAAGLL